MVIFILLNFRYFIIKILIILYLFIIKIKTRALNKIFLSYRLDLNFFNKNLIF